jgi:hypothetical protein
MSSRRQQARTLILGVLLMVVAGFAPAIAMGVVGWSNGVPVAILAGLAVFIACIGGTGWRTGLVISLPFALLAGLTQWAAADPVWAASILAFAAFLRGYAARAGMHDALIMTVIALGFIVASPLQPDVSLGIPVDAALKAPMYVACVALVAALWATAVMFMLRRRLPLHQHTGLDPRRVMAFSLVLALLVGVATWAVVALDLGHTGGWIILTIVVVFQPSLGAGFTKAAHRAAGTILGFLIAILVGLFVHSTPLVYLVGAAFLMAAFLFMLQGRPYWLYATVLTPAIVLLESGGSTVGEVAQERLEATLIGVAVTLVVMLALAPFSTRLFGGSSATRT